MTLARFLPAFILSSAALVLSGLGSAPGLAHGYTAGTVEVIHPWARPTVSTRQPGAAYFALRNTGSEADRLIGARPIGFAEAAELHTHINDDGVMRMRPIPAVELPAGELVLFEPGGLHVMLYGLDAPLTEGRLLGLVLQFEKAGEVEVAVLVENRTDTAVHEHH